MFFYLGENCPVTGLNQIKDNLYLDNGWEEFNGIYYKGYSTDCSLTESIPDILYGYKPRGKWCVIDGNKILHPILRGFPLYENNGNYSNLKIPNFNLVTYPGIEFPTLSEISIDDASILIGDIVYENIVNFYKYNTFDRMNVLYSAGLDTLTGWAVLDSYTKDYRLSIHVPTPTDDTRHKRSGRMRQYENDFTKLVSESYWGYNVMSLYTDTNWYITGYYAETIQLRDGAAINALANYHNKKIYEVANNSDYLYFFLKRKKIVENFKNSNLEFKSESELKKFLWKTIFYDHQMWHIDNNMSFCPLFDSRITEIAISMSVSDILKNALTGEIQKNIVKRFNPSLLTLLSDYKNEGNMWGNFVKNWSSIKLDSMVEVKFR